MSETNCAEAQDSARPLEWMDTPEKRRAIFAGQVLATVFTGDLRRRREMEKHYRREDARCATPKLRVCPRCRGYDLESQWCDHCKGAGHILVPNDGRTAMR